MRIGIVVDSSCDLPPEFIQGNNIKILPSAIRVDNDLFADERDPEATLAFYESHIGDKTHDAETRPFSVDEIERIFLERLVLDFDYVFCLPVWRARSRLYDNCTKAAFAILSSYRKYRARAGVNGVFSMRVVDSRTLFAGQAVQAAEVAHMVQSGNQPNEIRQRLGELVEQTVAYMVPADLAYIRQRTMHRGEKSINLATYLIGTALDIKPVLALYREQTQPVAKLRGYKPAVEKMLEHVARIVYDGQLVSRHVCVSYGGDPAAILQMPGYAELDVACRSRGVTLLRTFMGAVVGVNVGAGALSVAYVGDYREMT